MNNFNEKFDIFDSIMYCTLKIYFLNLQIDLNFFDFYIKITLNLKFYFIFFLLLLEYLLIDL